MKLTAEKERFHSSMTGKFHTDEIMMRIRTRDEELRDIT